MPYRLPLFNSNSVKNRSHDIKPPRLPLKALRWFCDPELLEDVEGDLAELFYARASKNRRIAKLLYARDVLQLFRPGIIKNFEDLNPVDNIDMLFNHIRTAIRQATKYKGYTTINIAGLVVGLASCMLILLWVPTKLRKISSTKSPTGCTRCGVIWSRATATYKRFAEFHFRSNTCCAHNTPKSKP